MKWSSTHHSICVDMPPLSTLDALHIANFNPKRFVAQLHILSKSVGMVDYHDVMETTVWVYSPQSVSISLVTYSSLGAALPGFCQSNLSFISCSSSPVWGRGRGLALHYTSLSSPIGSFAVVVTCSFSVRQKWSK